MRGVDGIAAAQWAAAVLSIFAIAIALYVFLAEQRRANAEKEAEASREREALARAEQAIISQRIHANLVVTELLNRTYTVMTEDLPDIGHMYVTWSTDRGKPFKLKSLRRSIVAIQRAVSDDIEMLIDLSDAITVIDSTISPAGMDRSPHVSSLLLVLNEQAKALDEVRSRLSAARAKLEVVCHPTRIDGSITGDGHQE